MRGCSVRTFVFVFSSELLIDCTYVCLAINFFRINFPHLGYTNARLCQTQLWCLFLIELQKVNEMLAIAFLVVVSNQKQNRYRSCKKRRNFMEIYEAQPMHAIAYVTKYFKRLLWKYFIFGNSNVPTEYKIKLKMAW